MAMKTLVSTNQAIACAIVNQPKIEQSSRIFFHRHCLLIAGIHATRFTLGMRNMTRVDATLDFEFKGYFEGHKVNCGQNVGFKMT